MCHGWCVVAAGGVGTNRMRRVGTGIGGEGRGWAAAGNGVRTTFFLAAATRFAEPTQRLQGTEKNRQNLAIEMGLVFLPYFYL
jgi:hypothetical protein